MAEQPPMTTQNTAGLVPGQQPAMPTPNFDSEQQAKNAAAGQRAYDEAILQMPDHGLYGRIIAAHPHAMASPEAVKVMQEDYARLKQEQDRQQAEATAAKARAVQEQQQAQQPR
jgi:hypothetical protein